MTDIKGHPLEPRPRPQQPAEVQPPPQPRAGRLSADVGLPPLGPAPRRPEPTQQPHVPAEPAGTVGGGGHEGVPAAPRVSVLMPVYNAVRYVQASVRSVLSQTYTDFELIVIDDGSDDGSTELLEALARDDARIRLRSRPNTGYIRALNEGLGLARGVYIARLDADDLAHPDRFALQVAALDTDAKLVAVGAQADMIDDTGAEIADAPVPLTHDEIERYHLAGASMIHHPAVMMRRDAVVAVGGYLEGIEPCEDFDLWLKLGEIGRLANLPQKLLSKRLLADSAVVSGAQRHAELITEIMARCWARRGLAGTYQHKPVEMIKPAEFFRQWGWMALRSRNTRVGLRYGLKALRTQPLNGQNWRLLFCVLRGY